MTTITVFKALAKVLSVTLLIHFSSCWADDSQDKKTNDNAVVIRFITSSAKNIGGSDHIGVNAFPNWSDNPEVKEVAGFESNKRVAILMSIISDLNKDEEKEFPNAKSDSNQLAATLITRLLSLTQLNTLISSSDNDVVVKDYFDGEIADLKLVLSRKISPGMYFQSRDSRGNKLFLILMQDKMVVTEWLTLERNNKGNIAQVLANKTYLLSLLNMCIANPDLCAKL